MAAIGGPPLLALATPGFHGHAVRGRTRTENDRGRRVRHETEGQEDTQGGARGYNNVGGHAPRSARTERLSSKGTRSGASTQARDTVKLWLFTARTYAQRLLAASHALAFARGDTRSRALTPAHHAHALDNVLCARHVPAAAAQVQFSPFEENKLAIATGQHYGIVGNGRLFVAGVMPGQVVVLTAFVTHATAPLRPSGTDTRPARARERWSKGAAGGGGESAARIQIRHKRWIVRFGMERGERKPDRHRQRRRYPAPL